MVKEPYFLESKKISVFLKSNMFSRKNQSREPKLSKTLHNTLYSRKKLIIFSRNDTTVWNPKNSFFAKSKFSGGYQNTRSHSTKTITKMTSQWCKIRTKSSSIVFQKWCRKFRIPNAIPTDFSILVLNSHVKTWFFVAFLWIGFIFLSKLNCNAEVRPSALILLGLVVWFRLEISDISDIRLCLSIKKNLSKNAQKIHICATPTTNKLFFQKVQKPFKQKILYFYSHQHFLRSNSCGKLYAFRTFDAPGESGTRA